MMRCSGTLVTTSTGCMFTDSVQNGIGQYLVDRKPFISLFDVTNATTTDPEIAGIPDLSSAVALELFKDPQGEHHISMMFKNGAGCEYCICIVDFCPVLANGDAKSTIFGAFPKTILRGCSIFDFSKDPFLYGLDNTGYSQKKAERGL
ncbi:hypothetical protein DFH29DRAFT_877990 [Suillus ampliporus]|nr:hypothetical protein DFH29DRAFT_877990 [Suillus ampliporus]